MVTNGHRLQVCLSTHYLLLPLGIEGLTQLARMFPCISMFSSIVSRRIVASIKIKKNFNKKTGRKFVSDTKVRVKFNIVCGFLFLYPSNICKCLMFFTKSLRPFYFVTSFTNALSWNVWVEGFLRFVTTSDIRCPISNL